jgi:hypothetical protein
MERVDYSSTADQKEDFNHETDNEFARPLLSRVSYPDLHTDIQEYNTPMRDSVPLFSTEFDSELLNQGDPFSYKQDQLPQKENIHPNTRRIEIPPTTSEFNPMDQKIDNIDSASTQPQFLCPFEEVKSYNMDAENEQRNGTSNSEYTTNNLSQKHVYVIAIA